MLVFFIIAQQTLGLIEFDRSLMDGTGNQFFSNDDGWYINFDKQVIQNSAFINGVQYLGLSIISQDKGAVKVFSPIPPHSMLQVSGKIAIYGAFQHYTRRIQVRIDDIFVLSIALHSPVNTTQSNPLLYEFNGFIQHTYSLAVLQFTNDFSNDLGNPTMGFREIILSYAPCPVGCAICYSKDQAVLCKQWAFQYESFKQKDIISNDGWNINGQTSYTQCQGLNFGVFDNSVQLNRTILLEPHYEIRIIFLLTQIDFDAYNPSPFSLYLDDVQIFGYQYMIEDNSPDICSNSIKNDNDGSRDVVKRFDVINQHTKRFANISFFQSKIGIQNIAKFSIRDFQIYIKKCILASDAGVPCDECTGPTKQDCLQQAKITNYKNVVQSDFIINKGWQVTVPTADLPRIYCNGNYLLGLTPTNAKDYYLQKDFYNIKSHTFLNISFTLYQIDDYNNELIQVIVDNVVVKTITLVQLTYSTGVKWCDIAAQFDQKFDINIIVPHKNNQAHIQIVSKQSQTTAHYGIKNFELLIDAKSVVSSDLKQPSTNLDSWIATKISQELNVETIMCPGLQILGVLKTNKIRRLVQQIDDPNNAADYHCQLQIKFSIYAFSTNLSGKVFKLTLNQQLIWQFIAGAYNYQVCGTNIGQIMTGDVYIDHTQKSDAVFEFVTDASDELWGIQSFTLNKNVVC